MTWKIYYIHNIQREGQAERNSEEISMCKWRKNDDSKTLLKVKRDKKMWRAMIINILNGLIIKMIIMVFSWIQICLWEENHIQSVLRTF